ncbi:TetR family transcriptional regulator [Janibacter melonis]|uniref:TetR family transcriptional regulator n=1 Tax=Janibacter melonis TaxID=262209 RepID=UPI001F233569|nr:TetR/AcrR family transcriptional regulator C-terminal domain-containing protein [Janibacter melonis]
MPAAPRRPVRRRADVVAAALDLLARVGLPDLTMRALGAELGVQQSAIYHHVESKQALLGAVADEILARGPRRRPRADDGPLDVLRLRCEDVRAAVLAYPDGADVVMSMWAFGLGGRSPVAEVDALLESAGVPAEHVTTAGRTVLHFVYGHAYDEQSRAQAARAGIVTADAPADFATGLGIVLAGVRALAEDGRAGGSQPG